MIKELIHFTERLDEEFKNLGTSPKEGLHILLRINTDSNGLISIDTDDFQYEQYTKKEKEAPSVFLNNCKSLHQNAWCIDTNKCFDLPMKAIHSCSPYSVAFKREHLEGGAKYKENEGKKKQIYERFEGYFSKAFSLFSDDAELERYTVFKHFFTLGKFSEILYKIENENLAVSVMLEEEKCQLLEQQKQAKDKAEKETLKNKLAEVEQKLLKVKALDDASYIIFYLDLPLERYKEVHKKYLDDKLFNTDKYNTVPDEDGLIFGTNNFLNGFNGNMPFLMHTTATFDITGRISNIEAKMLYELNKIFPNKTLPNPLPLFVYRDELLSQQVIDIYKESNFKFGYQEIVREVLKKDGNVLANYYLLFWQNTKDGLVFKDFDYVSNFEYKMNNLTVRNLFELKEKGGKADKHYHPIETIFDFEDQIFKTLIQSKYRRVDYFGDLNRDDYAQLDRSFESFSKYRKAIYDFVYKSQRQSIDGSSFNEMVFNSIMDDLKHENKYGVQEKLNIWYSLYDYFNPKQKLNMVNKLKEYQDFITDIISDNDPENITDESFAFAAGQVISYILSKSKSADRSYVLLAPYLQQAKCVEFKKAITNDFDRYKHENFSSNFNKVAAFVMSYETNVNLKHLQPQILSGVFAKNQLFSSIK